MKKAVVAIVCCGCLALRAMVSGQTLDASPSPTADVTPTPTPEISPSPTPTPVMITTASPDGSPTPTQVISPTPTATLRPIPEPSPSPTPTPTTIPEASPLPTRGPGVNEADLIHFGDIVDVDLVGGFEYDWRGGLTPDGTLDGLQTAGDPIVALCRAEADVAADIVKVYSRILRDPKFKVRIIDRSGRAEAQLNGAVKIPMRFRLLRPAHLRELIVAAGGLTDDTSGDITIYRPPNLGCASSVKDNALQTINITVSDLLAGKASADPLILSGDLITVGKAVPIYVIGAVNNPRPVYSRAGMTLTRAIATAGGLAKNAVEQKVTVFRKENDVTRTIEADLEKIRTGQAGDVELKAFDIIEVAFRGGATRKYPPEIISGDKPSGRQEPPLKIID